MSLAPLIDRMIAAGMSAGEAGAVAAEIYAAGVASADIRSSNAVRQQRYRDRKTVTNRNETVTNRNGADRNETVTNRNEPVTTLRSANVPISTLNTIKESKRANRGTRIDPNWVPSAAEIAFAVSEGFSVFEANREAQKFRDHWLACAGARGVKLDWGATWRKWIMSAAGFAGKAPAASTVVAMTGFYAKAESEQLAAWDTYALRTTGKGMPRDKNQGWHVKSEWPPKLEEMA